MDEIIRGIQEGKTQAEIAVTCGVSRKTIERDFREWRTNGGFEEWLSREWIRLHRDIKTIEPRDAYREVSSLLGKTLKQKVEAEVKGGIVLKAWGMGEKDAKSPASGDPVPAS